MDGLLQKKQFIRECYLILGMSDTLQDKFILEENQKDCTQKYLCREEIRKRVLPSEMETLSKYDEEFFVEGDMDEEKDDHQCCVAKLSSNTKCNDLLTFQHHILYSESYNVPVMYFLVSKQDGRMLSLDEVWDLIPFQHQHALKEKWSFVTQQEHPYLLRPFFQLHPCQTATMMKSLCGSCKPSNYLLLWLSAISSIVQFTLSMKYFEMTK